MNRWAVLIVFLIGIAIGVAGTLYGPRYANPYLPEGMRQKGALVEGEVARKLKEADRLLLTVITQDGAVLATFKHRITEIELLVKEGDLITLALDRYEPFVENPEIARVRKAGERSESPGYQAAPSGPSGAAPPAAPAR